MISDNVLIITKDEYEKALERKFQDGCLKGKYDAYVNTYKAMRTLREENAKLKELTAGVNLVA